MKTKSIRMTALALLPAALFILTSCSSTSQSSPPVGSASVSYTKGVPGGVIVQTVKLTATVTAIDHAKRTATLLVPDGKKFAVKVGREAVNFDQVRVGDQIAAVVTQRMVVSVEKGGATSVDGTAAVVARAPQGGQPGGVAAETTQVTAKIIAIDVEKHTVTLEFDDGNIQTVVRDDVDLSRQKVGEHVVYRITQMTAIWVEKGP
jgi:hypothetical protein